MTELTLTMPDDWHLHLRDGALLDETVPAGCVRVAAAHASTAALGDMFGTINVERA